QSIYGWRGAEVQHILNFRKDWPDAKVVRLEENYRSSGEIITLANRLIQHNRLRHDKKLIPVRGQGEKPTIQQFASEDEEAEQIIANIARRIEKGEVEPRDIAILFRTNEQPRLFETELRKRKLPYVLIGGMSFFDRKEIRDCLAYMQLIADPNDDVSLMRVINTPPRGIGPKTVESLMAESLQQQHSLWDHISTESTTARLTMGTRQSLRSFVAKIDEYRTRAQAEPLTSLTRQMIHDVGYRDEINQHYPEEADRESRWNSVEELVNALGEFEDKKSRRKKKVEMSEFLDDILLSQFDSTDDKEKQLRRNAIVLMTLHAAKGLEFPQVYLVGLEEGILPHQRSVLAMDDSIDEERRLCYVGVTRAQERLTLSRCESRRKWGKQRQAYASRFLYELADMADRARDAIEGYLKSMHIASDAAQQPSRKRKKKA
ncbi:MAG: exodeoxyribonuclease V subunit gamma, partial [Planctomycetales bacterium]|nr:exodeoxyribonuclease V subunit gamma [Planctomycetales bacterium]